MYYFLLIYLAFLNSLVYADKVSLPDSHAPISVMADHTHKKNEIMFSYRFMNMNMNKLFYGNNEISANETMSTPNGASNGSGTYMNAPTSMNMDMHMLGFMYAPTDLITFMLMNSYNQKEMTQQRMAGVGGAKFDVNSSGFGDFKLSALVSTNDKKNWKNHIAFGVSFPTGSIDVRDRTPASNSSRLGYNMQNGTGTYDSYFLFNNINIFGKIRVGEQIFFKTPMSGKNDNNYKYGNDFNLKFWSSYRVIDQISTSLNLNYKYKGKFKGTDDEMNKRMSPAMDSHNHGYQKVNLGIGLNFINHEEFFSNHRLGFELIIPLYQKYNGIQMAENFSVVAGWQYSF